MFFSFVSFLSLFLFFSLNSVLKRVIKKWMKGCLIYVQYQIATS